MDMTRVILTQGLCMTFTIYAHSLFDDALLALHSLSDEEFKLDDVPEGKRIIFEQMLES